MSLEHSPARQGMAVTHEHDATGPPPDDPNYWHALINEREAAKFLNLEPRTMQGYRRKGGGPEFIRISSRCIRYRRIGLKKWADDRLRTSTSDPGQAA